MQTKNSTDSFKSIATSSFFSQNVDWKKDDYFTQKMTNLEFEISLNLVFTVIKRFNNSFRFQEIMIWLVKLFWVNGIVQSKILIVIFHIHKNNY